MRAHNVIILTSGRSDLAATGALDRLVEVVVALKKFPIVVLGPDGDEFLRLSEKIEHCDIVFDPNYAEGFFSGIKAGLHATNGAAYVLPLTEELPEASLFGLLERDLIRLQTSGTKVTTDVIRPSLPFRFGSAAEHAAGPQQQVYPQIVTARGVRALIELPASTDWHSSKEISVRSLLIESDSQMTA